MRIKKEFHTQHADLAQIFRDLVEALERKNDKAMLSEMVRTLSGHQIAALKILVENTPRIMEEVIPFYQERFSFYRSSLRTAKFWSFRSYAKIDLEASGLAWEDTNRFLSEISLLGKDEIALALDVVRLLLGRFSGELLRLSKDDGVKGRIGFNDFSRIVEGDEYGEE